MKSIKIMNNPKFIFFTFHISLSLYLLNSTTLINAQEKGSSIPAQTEQTVQKDQIDLDLDLDLDLKNNDFDPYGLRYVLNDNEILLIKGESHDAKNEPLCYNISVNIMNFVDPVDDALKCLSEWSQNLNDFPKVAYPEKPHSSLKAWFNYFGQRVKLARILKQPQFLYSQNQHNLLTEGPHLESIFTVMEGSIFSPTGEEYVLIKNLFEENGRGSHSRPCVYSTSSGNLKFELKSPNQKHKFDVCQVIFSQDGQIILSKEVTQENSLNHAPFIFNIWNANSGSLINSFFIEQYQGHFDSIPLVTSLSNDGKKLLTFYKARDKNIKIELRDTLNKEHAPRSFAEEVDSQDNSSPFNETCFATLSPNGKIVATNTASMSISLFNAESGKLQHFLQGTRINEGAIDPKNKVIFSPNSELILSNHFDNPAEIWDTKKGNLVSYLKNSKNKFANCFVVSFSPDSQTVVGVSEDEEKPWEMSVGFWEVKTGKLIQSFYNGDKFSDKTFGEPLSLNFSPDGTKLIITYSDNIIRFWNTKSGNLESTFDFTLQNNFLGNMNARANLSPDSKHLLIQMKDRRNGNHDHNVHVLKLNFYGNKTIKPE